MPITFVGGYLGAGKTTVINELLAVTDRPIAVIVNDVGAINIDAKLIRRSHGDTVELTNGCICCGSLDEMGTAFDRIRARPQPPDHVIVELSGVAEPQRMIPWGQSAGFMLDGVVVVVAVDQLSDALPDIVTSHIHAQIGSADLLILTKTDLSDSPTVAAAQTQLSKLAPTTPIVLGTRDGLGSGAMGRFLALGGRRPGGPTDFAAATLFDAHETRTIPVPCGTTSDDLKQWLHELPNSLPALLVRAKGLVDTIDLGLVLVQIVGSRCEVTAVPIPDRQPPTDLVIISLRPEFAG